MVKAVFSEEFSKKFRKITDNSLKDKIIKQTIKIRETPEIGKPMMYSRKNTRELYVKPYRLSYAYVKEEDRIFFLDIYHKDEQ